MKTLLIFIALFIAMWIIADAIVANASYTFPRCYYPATEKHYIPTRIYQNTNGTHSCYVNVGGKIKSMGVAVLEEPTGIRSNGTMTYENTKLYYAPTNQTLTVVKKNDSLWGTGWYLMTNDSHGYPLYNNYGRTLLMTGVIQ